MRTSFVIAAIAFCTAGVPAFAATTPDFTGTWLQNNAHSSVAAGAPAYSNKIAQHEGTLEVTTIIAASGDRKETMRVRSYAIGGKPETSTDKDGDEFTSSVKWQEAVLVFETVEAEKAGTITTRETWTMAADGKSFTKNRHSSSLRGESDRAYVLEKQ